MWQQIEANKRKTFFVLFMMTIFVIMFGLCTAILFSSNISEVIVYNIIFYLIFIAMFIYGYKRPLSSFGDSIYKYNGEDDKTLLNVVSEMKIASGLAKMPEIYILDSSIMNAFACGTNPNNAKIVVSKGLLEVLNRDELQGVIGHEIAHIVNRDTCYLLYASIIVNIIANISNIYFRSITRSRRSSSSSQADLIVFIFALVFIILAPIFANMFYFFLSRKREYLADACSAQYTRYPEGLASALKKISGEISKPSKKENVRGLKNISSPLAQASFIIPLKSNFTGDGLFSTHPSTQNRIKILMGMSGRADLSAYNTAYENVTKKHGLMKLSKDEQTNLASRGAYKEALSTDNLKPNINAQLLGLAGSAQAESSAEDVEAEIKNHRKVEDMMWNLAHYITIDCACKTKLRLPKSYIGQTITCPHCKTQHVVKEFANLQ